MGAIMKKHSYLRLPGIIPVQKYNFSWHLITFQLYSPGIFPGTNSPLGNLSVSCYLGAIQELCEPNLQNFDPPPPSSKQKWTFYLLLPFVT